LNHLILDLREFYKNTPEYKRVHRKDSFDNWQIPIDTLEAWGVLLPKAIAEFRSLEMLRHRSIHFTLSTYATLRADAMAAISNMREIIEQQFTAFGDRPWFIKGTIGQIFIKRAWENDPFIRTYYLPTCPFVGPYFAISFAKGLAFHDHIDYGDGEWTDEEFVTAFNSRSPEQVIRVTVSGQRLGFFLRICPSKKEILRSPTLRRIRRLYTPKSDIQDIFVEANGCLHVRNPKGNRRNLLNHR
jgi:hypothetical protein